MYEYHYWKYVLLRLLTLLPGDGSCISPGYVRQSTFA
uniref:Uncharacterized protein n=1 Tax=Siphoviridae sp. ctWT735 TaxID=2825538 RepID=A0A8S5TUC6_9CAUD|nr:MAG TPA: hypothetical protein [Siphoviridae sp. ctWT735]DAT98677.1 MAG TPA: hypothetical protein [Caudoviricetes sp.]